MGTSTTLQLVDSTHPTPFNLRVFTFIWRFRIDALWLQTTALSDLVRGRGNLKNDVSERTGQLKALVKENFDRFISCKNTIDDIHKRLRKSEAHDTLAASGNSTSDMVIAIAEVTPTPTTPHPGTPPLKTPCHPAFLFNFRTLRLYTSGNL